MITALNHTYNLSNKTDFSNLLLMHDIVKNRVKGGFMETLEWIILYLVAIVVHKLLLKDIQNPIVIDALNQEKYKKTQEKLHQILSQKSLADVKKLNWFWRQLYKKHEQIYDLTTQYSEKIDQALLLNQRKINAAIAEMTVTTEWNLGNIEKNYHFDIDLVFGKLECQESAEQICDYLRQNK